MIKTRFLRALALCLLFLSSQLHAQQIDTLTLQPDAAAGKDAVLGSLSPNTNSGTHPDFNSLAWTVSGNPVTHRSIMDFDFSSLPPNITVISATLSLYQNVTSGNGGHSNLSGSNVSWIKRITSPWDEDSVTWNTQPTTDTTNQVEVAQSTSPTQDYPNIDVTDIISDIIKDTSVSFGMLLMLQTEQYYRSKVFASSDNADPTLHPKLQVIYELDCWISSAFSVSSNNICEEDTVQLTNMSTGAEFYTWALDGSPIGTNADTFVVFDAAGSYTITLTADSGVCYETASEIITVNAVPAKPSIAESGVELASSSAVAYQWYYYDTLIVGATSQYYTATQSGFYSVVVFNSDGCSVESDPHGFTVTVPGIEQFSGSSSISLYPNPSDRGVDIKLKLIGHFHQLCVINALGQTLIHESIDPIAPDNYRDGSNPIVQELTFEISELSPGVYVVEVQGDFGVIRRNLLVLSD